MPDWSFFVTVLIGLFSLINPLGALTVYLTLTQDYTEDQKLQTLKKTCIYIFLICIVSYYIGVYILNFFGISIPALRLAGGLVIFRSGWQLLNVTHKKELRNSIREDSNQREDISFSPLAMPLLAGPGSMSFLITLFSNRSEQWSFAIMQDGFAILAVLIVVIALYFIFKYAPRLIKYTGQSGILALSKIMGFIVIGIGVQQLGLIFKKSVIKT
ncbi:MAG: MarC family NAAT transporter [Bacteroidia bacterium]